MKPDLKLFILETCPYCKQVFKWMDELIAENPKYAAIKVEMVNERVSPEICNAHDYYYVPTYFLDGEKVHEGACSKEKVREIFEKYLAK